MCPSAMFKSFFPLPFSCDVDGWVDFLWGGFPDPHLQHSPSALQSLFYLKLSEIPDLLRGL